MASHCIPWHPISSHCISSYPTTSHHIPRHPITSHLISSHRLRPTKSHPRPVRGRRVQPGLGGIAARPAPSGGESGDRRRFWASRSRSAGGRRYKAAGGAACGMLAPAAGPRRGAQTAGERWEGGEGRRSPPGGFGAGGDPRGSPPSGAGSPPGASRGAGGGMRTFFFLCLFVYLIVVFILPPCCRGKPALWCRGTERCRAARLAGTPAPRRPPPRARSTPEAGFCCLSRELNLSRVHVSGPKRGEVGRHLCKGSEAGCRRGERVASTKGAVLRLNGLPSVPSDL